MYVPLVCSPSSSIPFVLLIASILELDELYLGSLYYFFFLFSSPLYLHVQMYITL